MALTKLAGRQLKFTAEQAYSGSQGTNNAVIVENAAGGLVLSASRIYMQANPADDLEVATKQYVDSVSGGSLNSASIAFGDNDGEGFKSDTTFQFLTGSGGFSGGLFYGDMMNLQDGTAVRDRANVKDGGVPGVGSGSVAFNVARIYLTSSAQTSLKSAGSLVLSSSANAARAVQIGASGGTTATLHITSKGTATNAIDIDTDGGVDIDAAGAVAIDSSAGSITVGATLADAQTLKLGKNGATEMVFTPHGTAGSEKISLTNTSGTASDAIAITATAGGLDLNAVEASSITVASAGDEDDLTIEVTGANDASLILASAGTGTDAMSLDVTAGSMVVAPSLADGQTLKLGKNGATEMVFTPHGTAANEKISLTNTAGTASDAISITATAGGLDLNAVEASSITLASAGDEDDLTIEVTGANDASLLLSSAGTGTDAMSLDVTAGSMVVAPSLADGQTLKLGKNGATEMVFTPHGTPANEKISLTNTAGTASDAISLSSVAGGFAVEGVQASSITVASAGDADDLSISVTGANDASLLLSSAGTGTDAIDIHGSAGDIQFRTSASGKSVSVSAAGGGTQKATVESAGTGNDAIRLNASAGGIDIDSAKVIDIAAADGGVNVTAGADDNITLKLGNNDAGEKVSFTNSDDTEILAIKSDLSVVMGMGTLDTSPANGFKFPAFVDNVATVTAPVSASAGYTSGVVNAGSGIAEIYYSGSLHNGQSVFLTGGMGAESIYANSLRVYMNGLLLLSGASNDYTTALILTGTGNQMGGLRVDFVDQPLHNGDVLQFHARARVPAT